MHFFFYDRNLFPIQDILEVPDRGKSMYWLILKNKTFFLVHKIQLYPIPPFLSQWA